MPNVRFLVCLAVFSLGCATQRIAAERPAAPDPPPARQAEAPVRPAASALRVRMSVLPGWKEFSGPELRGASLGFRNDSAEAVITARIIPAGDASLDGLMKGAVGDLARLGVVCDAPAVEGESYAIVRCLDRRDGPPARSVIAVRRPSGHSDVLLMMVGGGPASLAPSFFDEVDLMFLLASVE
ncbi:MAG: hypothetical protein RL272_492 [Candidatus Parcubacteria bacterium]